MCNYLRPRSLISSSNWRSRFGSAKVVVALASLAAEAFRVGRGLNSCVSIKGLGKADNE